MSFHDEENYNSKFSPIRPRKPKLEDEINRFNRGLDTMTPEQFKFLKEWTAEGEREAAEVANEDSIEAMYAKIRAEIDAEGAEQSKWEKEYALKDTVVPNTGDADKYNIDHLLVGTPSNPVDFNELRKIAVEKHRKKYVPTPFDAASIASEMAAAQPKINIEDLINEVVASDLAKYKAEGEKVATPVFKVGGGIDTKAIKHPVNQEEFDMFKGEELSLPGMMKVINEGNTTSVDLSDPQVVAPIEATKQRDFGLDDGLTAIERQVNKINANSKVDLNKPPWIQGQVGLIPAGKNVNKNTHNISLGANLNIPFDSFDKNNVTEDKDLYQMLQELEGNWK